jgi:hypothetical protein
VEGIEVTAEEIAEEYQKVADQYDTELATVKSAVPESAIVGDMKARRAAEIIFNTGVPTEPVAEEAPAAEEAAEEKKPAKKTTKKASTKKAAEEAPAAEEAAEEEKPAKKTTKKTTKKAAAEEDTQSEE